MASMLSALLQFKGKPSQADLEAVTNAFTPVPGGVRILHYAWLNVLPDALGGGTYALLTTVYDEVFYKYIHDLVLADTKGVFNGAIEALVGFESCIGPDGKPDAKKYVDNFIECVRKADLASPPRADGAGYVAKGAYEAYDYTVKKIDTIPHLHASKAPA
jgi:hypothetical protein